MDYSVRVAQNINAIKAIEMSENAKRRELPPLVPLMDTLNEFVEAKKVDKLELYTDMTDKIGGPESQYYNACYIITQVMVLVEDEKQRMVVFYGLSGSGKSWLAWYMNEIFDCHFDNETKSIYNEAITKEEAHKQLYMINEANMDSLFKKKNLPRMKRLSEGEGINLENKYKNSFTGFVGSF